MTTEQPARPDLLTRLATVIRALEARGTLSQQQHRTLEEVREALTAAQPAPAPAGLREGVQALRDELLRDADREAPVPGSPMFIIETARQDVMRRHADRLTALLAQHPTPTPPAAGAGAEALHEALLREYAQSWATRDYRRVMAVAAAHVMSAHGLASLAQAQAEGGEAL